MQAHIAALIADVKALDAQATPGPWAPQVQCHWWGLVPCGPPYEGSPTDERVVKGAAMDARLIAHYRTAAPLLAAEVERQDEEIYILRACWRAAREAEQRAQDLLAAEREARARQEAERRAMLAADAVKP